LSKRIAGLFAGALERLQHADRISPWIEARDLRDERLVHRDFVLREAFVDDFVAQLAVLNVNELIVGMKKCSSGFMSAL
jgi:hypothetical protein